MITHPQAHLTLLERLETAYQVSQWQIDRIESHIDMLKIYKPPGFEAVVNSLQSSCNLIDCIDSELYNLLYSIEDYDIYQSKILRETLIAQNKRFKRAGVNLEYFHKITPLDL